MSAFTTAKPSLTKSIKSLIGSVVASACPEVAMDLYRRPVREPSRLVERLILCHLRARAIHQNRNRFFERLHRDFWQGGGGDVYSENCGDLLDDLCLTQQVAELQELHSLWSKLRMERMVEFGTCNGRLLDHLHDRFRPADPSTGIDINAEQIRRNQEKHDPSTLTFFAGDAQAWLEGSAGSEGYRQGKTLFISNGGVLEYFSRTQLDQMLSHIRSECANSLFFASEPVAADHDMEREKGSLPFGKELSFSHNYADVFEANGFELLHQRRFVFQQWTMMATIALAR